MLSILIVFAALAALAVRARVVDRGGIRLHDPAVLGLKVAGDSAGADIGGAADEVRVVAKRAQLLAAFAAATAGEFLVLLVDGAVLPVVQGLLF